MKRYKKNKRNLILISILALSLMFSLGYSYLNAELDTIGTVNYARNTWNIHFVSPPTITSGSVSGASVTTAAHVTGTDNDTVEYSVILTNPGDYYEFTITVQNEGTLDAMIDSVSNKVYSGNNEITQPDYVKSEIRYINKATVKENQILEANSSETLKVKVSYRSDIEANQLPGADTSLNFRFNVEYVQADDDAIEIKAEFNDLDTWEEIVNAAQANILSANAGDSKEVDMGEFGTHTLRVANTTTPPECYTEGFSQTACGLVLEFADIITDHKMNSTNTNVGGWPASEMRTYVNTDIYNALPTVLKNAIIDTTVVTGHGNTAGETNFTSTDKLYLLSTKEVWGKEDTTNSLSGDSAEAETRQLDYYKSQNVTTSKYSSSPAIKINNNGSYNYWWLRTPISFSNITFYRLYSDGTWMMSSSNSPLGVSPAFRIG